MGMLPFNSHHNIHIVRRHLMNMQRYDQGHEIRCKRAYVEGVVDQILRDAGKHVQVNQDMFHVVVYVGLQSESDEDGNQDVKVGD